MTGFGVHWNLSGWCGRINYQHEMRVHDRHSKHTWCGVAENGARSEQYWGGGEQSNDNDPPGKCCRIHLSEGKAKSNGRRWRTIDGREGGLLKALAYLCSVMPLTSDSGLAALM